MRSGSRRSDWHQRIESERAIAIATATAGCVGKCKVMESIEVGGVSWFASCSSFLAFGAIVMLDFLGFGIFFHLNCEVFVNIIFFLRYRRRQLRMRLLLLMLSVLVLRA